MGRNIGMLTLAANLEPLIGQPLDARQLVDKKSDLINPDIWLEEGLYLYNGMVVVVDKP